MSVLAHVVRGGPQQNEPAATQALTYILNSSPIMAKSFVRLLTNEHLEFEVGRIVAEQGQKDSQPDITIYDTQSQVRMFIENKFWAGLTKAQPVSYLNELQKDSPTALAFIVPFQRVDTVWNELKQRCTNKDLNWEDVSMVNSVMHARVDGKSLLVTSWKSVLARLLDVTNSAEGLDIVRADLLQLQGLVHSMNIGAFLPLHVEEASDQDIPNRLNNYLDLISDVIQELRKANIADTKGLGFGNSLHSSGHWIRIHANKQFEPWLGIHFKRWRDKGISPMWCQIKGHGLNVTHFENVPDLFRVVFVAGEYVWVPIRLKAGVERDEVLKDIVEQFKHIVDKVLNTITD